MPELLLPMLQLPPTFTLPPYSQQQLIIYRLSFYHPFSCYHLSSHLYSCLSYRTHPSSCLLNQEQQIYLYFQQRAIMQPLQLMLLLQSFLRLALPLLDLDLSILKFSLPLLKLVLHMQDLLIPMMQLPVLMLLLTLSILQLLLTMLYYQLFQFLMLVITLLHILLVHLSTSYPQMASGLALSRFNFHLHPQHFQELIHPLIELLKIWMHVIAPLMIL